MYFKKAEISCEIYGNRPIECRALECWNTKKIEAIYVENRLHRCSILEKIDWLKDLIKSHEAECGLHIIKELVEARAAGDAGAASELMCLVNYDRHLRDLVVEKGGFEEKYLKKINWFYVREFGQWSIYKTGSLPLGSD